MLTESLFREDGSLLWQVDFPNGYLLDNGTPNHREETIWVEIYDDGLEVEEEVENPTIEVDSFLGPTRLG